MNFLQCAKNNQYVIEAKEVSLASEVQEKVSAALWEVLSKRARTVEVTRIEYSSQMHKVVGFVVEPKNRVGALPCIIYNRGGRRDFGKILPVHLFGILAETAEWGYVVIASQYSGAGGSEGEDMFGGSEIEDIKNLYPILEAYEGADTERIGMYGGSRGGMMTYLMLTQVPWIKAAVTRAGLSNVFRNERERPGMKKAHNDIFGGGRQARIDRSALYWTEQFPKNVPLLLMHGTADWRVNVLDSMDLSKKLYQQKVPHRLMILEGGDHGLTEHKKLFMQTMREWFDRFVKEKGEIPNLELHGS